jgi:ADP-heptose:LPS heptosyltransferase
MKWFAHIPIRISMEQALGWKLGWEKWFYTFDLSFSDGWDYRKHRMSESFQHLMRLYVKDSESKFIPPVFRSSSDSDMKTVTQLLKSVSADKKKIAFCVATTDGFKDWPANRFSVIADWLIEKYNSAIIMTGVPKHSEKSV